MWLMQAGLQSLPPAHIKAACRRSLCKKGSASSKQWQTPGLLCSGSFPVGLIVKSPRLILSISSLQSRKLLFLIYWDRVKELQLCKTVFNGAVATNQANCEQVKGEKKKKKPAGRKVSWSHEKQCFGMRRAVLHKESFPSVKPGRPFTGKELYWTRQNSQGINLGRKEGLAVRSGFHPWITCSRQTSSLNGNEGALLPWTSSPPLHLIKYDCCYWYQRALSKPSSRLW